MRVLSRFNVATLNSVRGFFVRFQETPNEACYKFYVKGTSFLPPSSVTMLFDRTNDYQSPLAHSLLSALPMVEEVTIGESFVTVRRVEPDNAEAAAKYFAMKFHGSNDVTTDEQTAAERSQQLQSRVNAAMQEEEEEGEGRPSPPGSETTPSSFNVAGFELEQNNFDDALDEETLKQLIEASQWSDLKLHVSALITDHLHSGEPHVAPDAPHPHADTLPQEGDSEIVLMIKELIHTTIRPQLQDDGGDIRFCRFVADGGVMEVEMLGACRTCKSSKTTLVDLIERTTRHWIPEVKEVKQVERASAFEQFSADHEAAEEEEVDDEEDNSNRVEIEEKGQAADSGARVVRKVNESTESSVQ